MLHLFDRTLAVVLDTLQIYIPFLLLGIVTDDYTMSTISSFYSFFFLDDKSSVV